MALSLIGFHRGLITVAILFCFGYAGWEATGAGEGGRRPLVALLFGVLGIALAIYLVRLNRVLGYGRKEPMDGRDGGDA